MFDPETFGQAMGQAIREAVAPLQKRIGELEADLKKALDVDETLIAHRIEESVRMSLAPVIQKMAEDATVEYLAEHPAPAGSAGAPGKDGAPGADGKAGADGKSLSVEDVRPMLDDAIKAMRTEAEQTLSTAVKAIPTPKDGRDGTNGTSVTLSDVQPMLTEAIKEVSERSETMVKAAIAAIPQPVNGKDGIDGKDGLRGEKGADGLGLAGAMIDRDGALQITMTNGEVKSLGRVVGVDGSDGKDGLSLDGFELEYLPESHEISVKATAAGRVKELRYPAGGIRPGGYWREGTKAKAGEAWVHDGSTFYARSDTTAKPESKSEDWIIGARRGRDGETTVKTVNGGPPAPIKLGN